MLWSQQLNSSQIKAVNFPLISEPLVGSRLVWTWLLFPFLAYYILSRKVSNTTSSFKFLLNRTLADCFCNSQRDSCPNETLSNTCRRLIWRQIVLPSLKALRFNPRRFKHLIITLQATLIGAFQSKRSFLPRLLISLRFFVVFASPAVYAYTDVDEFLSWQSVLWKLVKVFKGKKSISQNFARSLGKNIRTECWPFSFTTVS